MTVDTRYQSLFGLVPETVNERQRLAELAGHSEALDAVEQFRDVLIHRNPLPARTQQLVHFAMLTMLAGNDEPTVLHAHAAVRAGGSAAELFGVCETAAVVGGMPAFTRAVHAAITALESQRGSDATSNASNGVDVHATLSRVASILIDVRDRSEYDAGHATLAINIPLDELANRANELPRQTRIACICRSGKRSVRAVEVLQALGFDAVSVIGGMSEWVHAQLPFYGADGQQGTVL
jgi:4-carboxymuconolactone decarboxylase